jgi:hypothetical protein
MAVLITEPGDGCNLRPRLVRVYSRRGVAVSALCLILAAAVITSGDALPDETRKGASEYELKAAFLYNFAKFVEWPAGAFSDDSAPIVVAVVGDDPFKGCLDVVVGKSANGRQVAIRRLTPVEDLRSCHVLFVCSSEKKRLSQIVANIDGASVLTVGEMEGFASNGGMIRLTMEDDKVRFEINVGMARRARLKVSSKLLSLAKRVIN